MTPKDSLFQLIHSLTKSEKRYFVLSNSLHSGKKEYMELYNFLESQSEYNEKAIKKHFKGRKMMENFSVMKSYLFEQIVSSLKRMGTYKDSDSDVNEVIETYKVLRYKGFSKEAKNYLNKAKVIATEDESFLRLYYILIQEYIEIVSNQKTTEVSKFLEISQYRKLVLSKIEQYTLLADAFYSQRIYLRSRQYARTVQEQQQLYTYIKPLLDMSPSMLTSRTSQGFYHLTLADYYNAIGKPLEAINLLREYIHQPLPKRSTNEMKIQRIAEVIQYVQLCVLNRIVDTFLKDVLMIEEMLNDSKKQMKQNLHITAFIYQRWLEVYLRYFIVVKDSKKGVQLYLQEKHTIEQYKQFFTNKFTVSIEYAYCYHLFEEKKYSEALQVIDKILTIGAPDSDEVSFAKILTLLIHYNMDNDIALEYFLRNTKSFLRSKSKLYQSEKQFFDGFSKLLKTKSKKKTQQIVSEMKDKLKKNFEDPFELPMLNYINIIDWLDSI